MVISRARLTILAFIALVMSPLVPVTMAQDATLETDSTTQTTREVLNNGIPEVVPGYELVLARVVIPPGSIVPAHMHPGMQLIYIDSGSIHYTVVSGELPFTKLGEDGISDEEEILFAGEETEFKAGDRFVEMEGMVHIAENRGDLPAVILASSLFAEDLPASIAVEVEPPATPNQ